MESNPMKNMYRSPDKITGNGIKEEAPKRLSETLDFINSFPEEEDYQERLAEYNKQVKEAADLMASGKMQESIELSKKLRINRPERKDFSEEQIKLFEKARAKLAKQLEYSVNLNEKNQFELEKNGYNVAMLHYMIPSSNGFKSGRISEIYINSIKDPKKDKFVFSEFELSKTYSAGVKKILDEVEIYFN